MKKNSSYLRDGSNNGFWFLVSSEKDFVSCYADSKGNVNYKGSYGSASYNVYTDSSGNLKGSYCVGGYTIRFLENDMR